MKRRDMLRSLAVTPVWAGAAALTGCGGNNTNVADGGETCTRTADDVEGPFYTADAPTMLCAM